MASDIKIRTLVGAAMKTYLPSMARVRAEVLKELPPLKEGSDLEYLKYLSQTKDAIAVVVFDGPKLVGCATALPLEDELAYYKSSSKFDPESYYYFNLSALLKPYRSRGVTHHFYDAREEFARHLKKFTKICFISPQAPSGLTTSTDQTNLELFWQKRGYIVHPEVALRHPRSQGTLKFWVKNIKAR